MAVKYIKDHKTQETVYPITKSECIIDSHSISGAEIDQLFDDSVNNSEVQESGMDYLNYDGLKQYHKKILEEVKTGLDNAQVDLTGYATESWVEEQNYLTEHQDISGIQNDVSNLTQRVGTLEENYGELTTYTEIIFSGAYGTHVLSLLGQVRKPQVTYNIIDKTLYCEQDSVIDNTLIFIGGETDKNTLIL